MQWEYKVIPFAELVETPSWWNTPWSKRMEQWARSMQDAINRMAQEDWEYADTISFPDHTAYIVFRKSRNAPSRDNASTGIKEL